MEEHKDKKLPEDYLKDKKPPEDPKDKKMPEEYRDEKEWNPASQSLAEALNLSLLILKVIMSVLVVLFLSSGVFRVEQDEVAMVLQFGEIQGNHLTRILKPGLHWTWPYPFSEVIRIPAGREHTTTIQDFWYYEKKDEDAKKAKIPETLDPENDGYCLTGDNNIIHCQWQIRYRIVEPYEYYTVVQNPQKMMEQIISCAVVRVVSTFPAHEALREKLDDFRLLVQSKAQEDLNRLRSGIEIQGIAIPQIIPPRQVQDAFESVLKAQNEKAKAIEMANNYKNQILNKARGEEAEILAKASNYARQIEKSAQSDAEYFGHVVELYGKYDDIVKEKHYQQVMEEAIKKVQELFLFTNKVDERELRIMLNRDPNLYKIKVKED